MIRILTIFFCSTIFGQSIDLNNSFVNDYIKTEYLLNKITNNSSLTIKPLNSNLIETTNFRFTKSLIERERIEIKLFPITYILDYNSSHPYNRNNGSLIPNRGYQHLIQFGFYLKVGPLELQLRPEQHFSENKKFDGFWDDHYPVIWSKRYLLWNSIDMPERFGKNKFNRILIGQSSIKLNFNSVTLGLSNESLWWGPSFRNSIMMSNHSQSFPYITFNTNKPINTFLGKFEWQLISGKLKSSDYKPPRTDYQYAGTNIYVPKTNHLGDENDWRYLQALIISYSPKFIDGLTLGYIRWAQFYSEVFNGRYLQGNGSYFPVFNNLLRKNDKSFDIEAQTNQAAGGFMKWLWADSKAEIYFEYYLNDSKQNLRDFLLDTDNSRAATVGISKIFDIKMNKYLFNWEWTQMEQSASKLIRNADSWYAHGRVRDGYTNMGEVLGSSIGPGSNSHYLSINRINVDKRYGIGIEIIDQDNDFIHNAFASAKDFRRYWKDFNLHFKFSKINEKILFDANLVFIRSLNYQWELDDTIEPYYHPGRDKNNFHLNIKLSYLIP